MNSRRRAWKICWELPAVQVPFVFLGFLYICAYSLSRLKPIYLWSVKEWCSKMHQSEVRGDLVFGIRMRSRTITFELFRKQLFKLRFFLEHTFVKKCTTEGVFSIQKFIYLKAIFFLTHPKVCEHVCIQWTDELVAVTEWIFTIFGWCKNFLIDMLLIFISGLNT